LFKRQWVIKFDIIPDIWTKACDKLLQDTLLLGSWILSCGGLFVAYKQTGLAAPCTCAGDPQTTS
uniref:ADP-ribosylation factor-related protein 1 n=1 Tax=Haemonchus placei TaxID=6290 RepID=A0A0N4WQG6_HAEPC